MPTAAVGSFQSLGQERGFLRTVPCASMEGNAAPFPEHASAPALTTTLGAPLQMQQWQHWINQDLSCRTPKMSTGLNQTSAGDT